MRVSIVAFPLSLPPEGLGTSNLPGFPRRGVAVCFRASEPNETLPLPDGAFEAESQVSSAIRNRYVKDNDDAPDEMHVPRGLLASGASQMDADGRS